jgi:hypothetical protein
MEYSTRNNGMDTSIKESTFIISVNEVKPDGSIAIQGRLPTVAETAAAVTPLAQPKDWKKMEAIIREEVVERYRSESNL